jgi:NADPH-dependent F420 reductase
MGSNGSAIELLDDCDDTIVARNAYSVVSRASTMRIALCGGTGDLGRGLALRLTRDTDHEVVVGSRDPEKAREHASEYETELDSRDIDGDINGFDNAMAADRAAIAILCVPAYHLADTIDAIEGSLDDTILVSPAVGMPREEDTMSYNPPSAGSVTALATAAAPDDTPVVGAFHNLAAGRLADLDASLDWDVLVVGDDADGKATIENLADGIDGIRALDAGPLAAAPEVESLTPLLINVATNNDALADLGVRFH